MTDIETLVSSGLDHRYPRPVGEPDWDDVLHRLSKAEAAPVRPRAVAPPRRPRRLAFAVAIAVLAAALASLGVVAPWKGSPSLVQQALAAIGSGRYVHAVLKSTSVVRQVDLASGKARELPALRVEWVYDSKTGASRVHFDADSLAFSVVAPSPDPAVSLFATGYRAALRNGRARVVGTTTIDGRKAAILRFTSTDGYEDVTVSTATHIPLRIAHVSIDQYGNPQVGRIYRVLAIDSSTARPTVPKANSLPPQRLTAMAAAIRPLQIRTARAALGHTPVWLGPAVAGTTLRAIQLERLTSNIPSQSTGRGLWFDYRGPRGTISLEESAKPAAAYGFFGPPTALYGFELYAIPPAGEALLSREDQRSEIGPTTAMWNVQLRTLGLYVIIRSRNRSLAVAAARALVPIR